MIDGNSKDEILKRPPHVSALLAAHEFQPEVLFDHLNRSPGLNLYYSTTCSLRCPYCVSNMHHDGKQRRSTVLGKLGPEKYVENVRRVVGSERRNVLHGGPGEVIEVDGFKHIFKSFADDGCIQIIQTNGNALPSLLEFFREMGREVMSRTRFNISYHLGSYLAKDNPDHRRRRFIEKCMAVLAEFDCRCQVITPMTPAVLRDDRYVDETKEIRSMFGPDRCKIKAMELGHIFNGKRYPQSYTKEESLLVKEVMAAVGTTRQIVDTPELVRFMGPKLRLRGMPCFVRLRTIKIGINGDVYFCTRNKIDVEGNIKDPDSVNVSTFRNVVFCPHEICSCKGMAYMNVLRMYGISPEEYYVAYWKATSGIDISTPDGRARAEHLVGKVVL